MVVLVGLVATFGGSYGLLQFGLRQPTGADRFAVKVFALLLISRGTGAVLHLPGRHLVSRCRVARSGATFISLSDGTRLLVIGQYIHPSVSPPTVRRARSGFPNLLEAEADLAGSHRLLALELAHHLDRIDVSARLVSYAGRPAYAILLSRRPSVTLVVARDRLKPIAVLYRSKSLVANSRLFRQVYARPGGVGC